VLPLRRKRLQSQLPRRSRYRSQRLLLRPHSATELVDRMVKLDLVTRVTSQGDRRQVTVRLTRKGEQLLTGLSETHRAELRRLRPLLSELMSKL